MVNIPTIERQFYNNTKKLNTFETYATTAYNSWMQTEKTMQDIQKDQEYVKIDTFQTEAQLKLNQVESDWRQKYINDPTNVNGLKELQSQRNAILEEYGSQISPIAKQKWNSVARNLSSKYEISNQQWGIKQNQENAAARMKLNMQNNYKLVNSLAANGDYEGAIAQLEQGYNQTLNAGARIMGTTQAALMVNDYKEKGMESAIYGLASTDTEKALDLLENDEKVKSILGGDRIGIMKKIMKNKIDNDKFNQDLSYFNARMDVSTALRQTNDPFERLQILDAKKDSLDDKDYKNFVELLEAGAGVNDETRSDEFAKIYREYNSIKEDTSDTMNRFTALQNLIDKVDALKKQHRISNKDYNSFMDIAVRGKFGSDSAEVVLARSMKQTAGSSWFTYGTNDAMEEIDTQLPMK